MRVDVCLGVEFQFRWVELINLVCLYLRHAIACSNNAAACFSNLIWWVGERQRSVFPIQQLQHVGLVERVATHQTVFAQLPHLASLHLRLVVSVGVEVVLLLPPSAACPRPRPASRPWGTSPGAGLRCRSRSQRCRSPSTSACTAWSSVLSQVRFTCVVRLSRYAILRPRQSQCPRRYASPPQVRHP